MIPKVIHYCWFGGNPLPKDLKKYMKSWKRHCPDYEIKEWNESNFDVHCHPFISSAYKNKAWAFVSDYARLKVIYDHGGIYFDTDVEVLKNLDFLLENNCFIGVEQGVNLCQTGLGFGAEKNNPVVGKMLEKYDGLVYDPQKQNELACPYLNMPVFEELGYQCSDDIVHLPQATVYPCRYFDPFSPGETENLLCEDTVSIHHYAAAWTSKKNQFKRRIIRLIGEGRVLKLKKLFKRA